MFNCANKYGNIVKEVRVLKPQITRMLRRKIMKVKKGKMILLVLASTALVSSVIKDKLNKDKTQGQEKQ
ncbi:hypothetical protein rsdtw13_22490 [Clostridium sp. TW13]|uniref:Uncharacterized protein n=1 Tax=Inconstantimicrobium mannanitabidum TaxID=1604901 RepID=A0ACB5RE03_9CLOT|nr:hypothetical protein rsdtw13_22490 [Clostridium sp. TW13]